MASFRKRNGLWQAQVRNKYVGSISKSFHIKSEAQKWAKEQIRTIKKSTKSKD